MKLQKDDLLALAEVAVQAAIEAGLMIAEAVKREVAVLEKSGGDTLASQVLTEVDLQSQEIILKHILPTLAPYDLALLSEESADDHSRLEKDYFWCIDPLDGTLPFIEKTDGFAVAIALVKKDGAPQLGVVMDPVRKWVYLAISGYSLKIAEIAENEQNPAFVEFSEFMRSRRGTEDQPALTFVTDRSFTKHPDFEKILAELGVISADSCLFGVDLISHGGATMNALWALEKSPGCYFKFPKKKEGGGSLWDYAASAAIYQAAGAVCSDIWGKPLDLNRADSTFMNHGGALYATDEKLAAAIRELAQKYL